jgi:hypothetical protein
MKGQEPETGFYYNPSSDIINYDEFAKSLFEAFCEVIKSDQRIKKLKRFGRGTYRPQTGRGKWLTEE